MKKRRAEMRGAECEKGESLASALKRRRKGFHVLKQTQFGRGTLRRKGIRGHEMKQKESR